MSAHDDLLTRLEDCPVTIVAARVHDELHQRGFGVDPRPGGIRVSPHFYSTADEAMAVLDAMSDVLAGR